MPASAITASVRYTSRGTTKIYWVVTIANYLAPSRGELNAGLDVSDEVADVAGFTVASDQIEVPDLSGRFTAKIPGRITADDSSLTCYASQNGVDVRAVLPRDTAGFMVILPEGDVTGQKMDVFPSKVSSAFVDPSIGDAGRVVVNFSITRVPAQNLVIP